MTILGLLSWGDLSRTQNKGKSEFLVGDNTNQQLNESKSIVNPKRKQIFKIILMELK